MLTLDFGQYKQRMLEKLLVLAKEKLFPKGFDWLMSEDSRLVFPL